MQSVTSSPLLTRMLRWSDGFPSPAGISLLVCLFAGCAGVNLQDALLGASSRPAATAAEISERRTAYLIDRDPAAFRWLLSTQLENGMSVTAVSDVLGEQGELYTDDRELKTHGGQYHQTDVAYRWGPDSRGRSVILLFRDGKLIHFDPAEFRS